MATIHEVAVEDGWEGILFAIDKAEVGDTITLAPGQYFGDQTLLINRPLTLQGSEGVELIYSGNDSAIHVDQTDKVSVLRLKISISNKNQDTKGLDCIKVSLSKEIIVQGNQCFGQGISGFGIAFFSSIGSIDTNECCGNICSGIVLKHAPKRAEQSSHAQLIGNRCHDNKEAGIIFSSSTGSIDNNRLLGK